MVACDNTGKLTLFNKAAREWHGIDAVALTADQWAKTYDLFRIDAQTPLATDEIPLLRAFQGEVVRDVGMAIVAAGRPPRFVLANGTPMFDPEKRKLGAVVAMRDITDIKRAEEELRESRCRQAEAEKLAAAGRMAAQIAHEINNPLAGIKNSFRLIRDAVPSDHPDHDMVERIEREIDRIAHVVRQMYELYSPRAKQPRDVPVGKTIRDMLLMLEPLCRECEVQVEVGPIPSELTVWVPEGSLQQVMYNLTVNAIQASPAGGKVEISAQCADEDYVEILVCDNGPGISADIEDRIFEPFFSTESADSTKKGLGLGLSIVNTIVANLEGKIDFQTAIGEGTCFRVLLPRRQL